MSESYPQVWSPDHIIKIKYADEEQRKEILHKLGRACLVIAKDKPTGGKLIYCNGEFYKLKEDVEKKIIEIRPRGYF